MTKKTEVWNLRTMKGYGFTVEHTLSPEAYARDEWNDVGTAHNRKTGQRIAAVPEMERAIEAVLADASAGRLSKSTQEALVAATAARNKPVRIRVKMW